jgi:glycerophosphoryl diester phosphodiesterase
LRVLGWTVNDPVMIERLFDLGADTVITDAIDIVAPALASVA